MPKINRERRKELKIMAREFVIEMLVECEPAASGRFPFSDDEITLIHDEMLAIARRLRK